MDLKEYCYSLTDAELLTLAIKVCEKALPVWQDYARCNALNYRDTVVGLRQEVKADLLFETVEYCKTGLLTAFFSRGVLKKLLDEFSDPIVALQNDDWELPYPVQQIFYSVHNLLKGITQPITIYEERSHYVTVNQAVDALHESGLMDTNQIKIIVYGS